LFEDTTGTNSPFSPEHKNTGTKGKNRGGMKGLFSSSVRRAAATPPSCASERLADSRARLRAASDPMRLGDLECEGPLACGIHFRLFLASWSSYTEVRIKKLALSGQAPLINICCGPQSLFFASLDLGFRNAIWCGNHVEFSMTYFLITYYFSKFTVNSCCPKSMHKMRKEKRREG